VKNAVVVINTATQGTNLVKLEEIEAHPKSQVREIVRIPTTVFAAGSVDRATAISAAHGIRPVSAAPRS
jgi:hypothetical protein